MKSKKPANYHYKLFRVCDGVERATTVSFSWVVYMTLLRRYGSDVKGFCQLVGTTALHLKTIGHVGSTLSAAVRKDVSAQLGGTPGDLLAMSE